MHLLFCLFFSLVFTTSPLSKKDDAVLSNVNSINDASVYVTDWEKVSTWNEKGLGSDKYFYYSKTLPVSMVETSNNTVVIVYTKGYFFSDTTATQKPVSLPFQYFLPENNRPEPVRWSVMTNEHAVEVSLQIPESITSSFQRLGSEVQLRYFVFKAPFLEKHKLTPPALHNLTYQQVVELAQIAP